MNTSYTSDYSIELEKLSVRYRALRVELDKIGSKLFNLWLTKHKAILESGNINAIRELRETIHGFPESSAKHEILNTIRTEENKLL